MANVVPSSPILVTLMMEALSSSETSVLKRAPQRNIPEDGIPQCLVYNSLSPVDGKGSRKWKPQMQSKCFMANVTSRQGLPSVVDDSVAQSGLKFPFMISSEALF
jgi:hypothetical protein